MTASSMRQSRKQRRAFSVLVATDGSPEATAAVREAAIFPWPKDTRVHGVVARRRLIAFTRPRDVLAALDRAVRTSARRAERVLRRRWPSATVAIEDAWAAEAILNRARRVGADVIVLGSRSRGMAARLLLGSVSRSVIRRASASVLIVHRRSSAVQRIVLGIDGSANARRAVALVASLHVPRNCGVVIVRIVEPVRAPLMPLVPDSARSVITDQATKAEAAAVREGERDVEVVATLLEDRGWKTWRVVRIGYPLPELLRVVDRTNADVLAIGARGVGGIEGLLLGSVAEGALNRCSAPTLLVR